MWETGKGMPDIENLKAAALAKFPKAVQIYPLIRKKKLTGIEKVLEWTVMPSFGLFEAAEQMSSKNTAFYLVETDTAQLFTTVTEEFIEYSELTKKVEGKRFEIGEYVFTKAGYELK